MRVFLHLFVRLIIRRWPFALLAVLAAATLTFWSSRPPSIEPTLGRDVGEQYWSGMQRRDAQQLWSIMAPELQRRGTIEILRQEIADVQVDDYRVLAEFHQADAWFVYTAARSGPQWLPFTLYLTPDGHIQRIE